MTTHLTLLLFRRPSPTHTHFRNYDGRYVYFYLPSIVLTQGSVNIVTFVSRTLVLLKKGIKVYKIVFWDGAKALIISTNIRGAFFCGGIHYMRHSISTSFENS